MAVGVNSNNQNTSNHTNGVFHTGDTAIERFISELYCIVPKLKPQEYRRWALAKLKSIIDFDAALWGTGHLEYQRFHYVSHIELDSKYADRLSSTIHLNPLREAVLSNIGQAISMKDVYPDDEFFDSELYDGLFSHYDITRILASAHLDERSGLYSLISVYRYDKARVFSQKEKNILSRVLFHLIKAASHSMFVSLEMNVKSSNESLALCDKHGYYYEVQEDFLNYMELGFGADAKGKLPFDLESFLPANEKLKIEVENQGELYRISARPLKVIDQLTDREAEITEWVTKGLSFKEIGKQLDIAPSTVSNHLYKIYSKLNITSRSELVKLLEE